MAKDADPLFPDYMLYGPYVFKTHGRKMIHMVRRSDRHRITMTWARYKMCVHLGRVLDTSEEVDHKDEDPHNDDLENLQILTRSENRRKGAGRGGCLWVRLRCPECSKIFERERRQTYLVIKSKKFAGCCRKCTFKFSKRIKLEGMSERVKELLDSNFVEEFRVFGDWKQ